jgi:hypothetical protein
MAVPSDLLGDGRRHDPVLCRDCQPGGSSDVLGLSSPRADRRQSPGPLVLVVFVHETACPWLRPLRRGYRHCFVVLRAGPLWVACEPLKDRIELDVLDPPDPFDLGAFYSMQGHRVLLGRRPWLGPTRRFAPAPLTCVTVVKRLLGMRAPWVWSPWQLYRQLCGPVWRFRPWSEQHMAPEAVATILKVAAGNAALDKTKNLGI